MSDDDFVILDENLEKHLIDVVDDWIRHESWEGDDEISRAIASANSIFDNFEFHDIQINLSDKPISFSLHGTMRGFPSKDDAPWRGDTIHFSIKGEFFHHTDIDDENNVLNYWDVDVLWDISATLEGMSVDDLLSRISTLPKKSWYRGHGDKTWKLKPSIARQDEPSHSLERELRLAFENRSTFLRSTSHPLGIAESNFMMQHHGLPTRLLDWSLSPLVALYFAVCDERRDKEDGCLWVLDPSQLNNVYKAPFPYVLDEEKEEVFEVEGTERVLAIHAPYADWRMKMQQSEFTLHSYYVALEEEWSSSLYLKEKIIIPSDLKPEIRERLSTLGITRETLFPDLDNIAKAIKYDILGEY